MDIRKGTSRVVTLMPSSPMKAPSAVIYDATSDKPLAYIDFGAPITAVEGTNFLVAWDDAGIFTLSYT